MAEIWQDLNCPHRPCIRIVGRRVCGILRVAKLISLAPTLNFFDRCTMLVVVFEIEICKVLQLAFRCSLGIQSGILHLLIRNAANCELQPMFEAAWLAGTVVPIVAPFDRLPGRSRNSVLLNGCALQVPARASSLPLIIRVAAPPDRSSVDRYGDGLKQTCDKGPCIVIFVDE